MNYVVWSNDLSTGISVIDAQHKRIIQYINQLIDSQEQSDSSVVNEVLLNLIDYTMSHFEFEEALMSEAGYYGASIHANTHKSFKRKIDDFQARFRAGEDIIADLHDLLSVWLIEHIATDDANYAPYVLKNMPGINRGENDGWLTRTMKTFFA